MSPTSLHKVVMNDSTHSYAQCQRVWSNYKPFILEQVLKYQFWSEIHIGMRPSEKCGTVRALGTSTPFEEEGRIRRSKLMSSTIRYFNFLKRVTFLLSNYFSNLPGFWQGSPIFFCSWWKTHCDIIVTIFMYTWSSRGAGCPCSSQRGFLSSLSTNFRTFVHLHLWEMLQNYILFEF